MKLKNFSRAFTLAEVLITLAIIGVVAAITIPTLMQKTQNVEYVSALKKAYSETNQALKLMANDYGCPGDLKCTELFASSGTDNSTLGDELVKYFHVAKNCKTDTNQGCWPATTNYYYDGSNTGANNYIDSVNLYKFVTADGMSFAIENSKNDCSTNSSTGRTGNMSQLCGKIYIDINGLKKPNAYGRDTFLFLITNGKGASLYPYGGADDKSGGSDNWWSNSSGDSRYCYSGNKWGYYCTARIMEEGWQMNY